MFEGAIYATLQQFAREDWVFKQLLGSYPSILLSDGFEDFWSKALKPLGVGGKLQEMTLSLFLARYNQLYTQHACFSQFIGQDGGPNCSC